VKKISCKGWFSMLNFVTKNANDSLNNRIIIKLEFSLELVNILAAKTVALLSGAKTGAPKLSTSFFP
jgi:hypothetical protein